MADLIERSKAIDAVKELCLHYTPTKSVHHPHMDFVIEELEALPSAEPEPLYDAYMKAVWTWLLDYQIKAAELKGRYTPYEVISWIVNDWRKEHE